MACTAPNQLPLTEAHARRVLQDSFRQTFAQADQQSGSNWLDEASEITVTTVEASGMMEATVHFEGFVERRPNQVTNVCPCTARVRRVGNDWRVMDIVSETDHHFTADWGTGRDGSERR